MRALALLLLAVPLFAQQFLCYGNFTPGTLKLSVSDGELKLWGVVESNWTGALKLAFEAEGNRYVLDVYVAKWPYSGDLYIEAVRIGDAVVGKFAFNATYPPELEEEVKRNASMAVLGLSLIGSALGVQIKWEGLKVEGGRLSLGGSFAALNDNLTRALNYLRPFEPLKVSVSGEGDGSRTKFSVKVVGSFSAHDVGELLFGEPTGPFEVTVVQEKKWAHVTVTGARLSDVEVERIIKGKCVSLG